jgi:hypothetical protein
MAYLSAPQTVTLNTAVIAARTLKVYWFNPATGASEVMPEPFVNVGSLTLEKRPQGGDWVVVIEDAAKQYPLPHS